MRTNVVARVLMAAAFFASGCRSYQGISKDPESREVYLAGTTSFLFFGRTWVAKCTEAKRVLVCKELEVELPWTPEKEQPPEKM